MTAYVDNEMALVNKILKTKKSENPEINALANRICAEILLKDQTVADNFRAALEAKFN